MPRTRNDILISLFLVLLFGWMVWAARDWPFRTRFFPWAIGFPILALAVIQLGASIWKGMRGSKSSDVDDVQGGPEDGVEAEVDPKVLRQRTLTILTWSVAYALGLWLFGFKVGGLLLTPAFLRFQAHESWLISILYALGVYLFFFAGLEIALAFPLPPGLIAKSLGLQSFDLYVMQPILSLIGYY